jgi:hypothetical protein
MTKKTKMPTDVNQRAAFIVSLASGETPPETQRITLVWSLLNNAWGGGQPVPPIAAAQVPVTTAMVTS